MSDTGFHKNIIKADSHFNPTCWTEVLAAGQGNYSSLENLCGRYWLPLYSYARKSGKDSNTAQDLTQGFFTWLLEKEKIQEMEQGKGKFRNFILILFKRYIINEFQKSLAEKRGGKLTQIDFQETEEWLKSADLTPEESFNKSWALTMIEQVMREIEQRFISQGDQQRFEVMRPHLDDSTSKTYKQSAAELGLNENSFKVAIHRLKKEFGKLLRLRIQATLDNDSDIDEELSFLINSMKK